MLEESIDHSTPGVLDQGLITAARLWALGLAIEHENGTSWDVMGHHGIMMDYVICDWA